MIIGLPWCKLDSRFPPLSDRGSQYTNTHTHKYEGRSMDSQFGLYPWAKGSSTPNKVFWVSDLILQDN